MKSHKWYFLVVALVAVMLLASACGGGEEPPTTAPEEPAAPAEPAEPTEAEAPAEEPAAPEPTETPAVEEPAAPHVLKVANTANITTWDPIKSFSTEAAYMGNIYEQLLRINPPGAAERFTPLLAESWESNEDGTEWTFYLRQGVKFHDGETMNAEAVKDQTERNNAG